MISTTVLSVAIAVINSSPAAIFPLLPPRTISVTRPMSAGIAQICSFVIVVKNRSNIGFDNVSFIKYNMLRSI